MENKIFTNDIIYNLVCDFKKKEISMLTRGLIIDKYIKDNNISINQCAIDLGISKTTAHAWHRFNDLGEENYNNLVNDGWKPSEIQNALKNGNVENLIKKVKLKRIDIIIDETTSRLREFIHKKDYSKDTQIKIRELQNVLNRILIRLENE
jgi:response regulator of citrate/malate metabolism